MREMLSARVNVAGGAPSANALGSGLRASAGVDGPLLGAAGLSADVPGRSASLSGRSAWRAGSGVAEGGGDTRRSLVAGGLLMLLPRGRAVKKCSSAVGPGSSM